MTQHEDEPILTVSDEPESRLWGLPLYVWVIAAVILAIPVGMVLGLDAARAEGLSPVVLKVLSALVVAFDLIPKLIIRALGALAAPWSCWRS